MSRPLTAQAHCLRRSGSYAVSIASSVIAYAVTVGLVTSCGLGGGSTEPTPVPTTVTVVPGSATFTALGATLQVSATVNDQSGKPIPNPVISWGSSSPAVASVNSSGLIIAKENGTTQITATADTAHGVMTVVVDQVPKVLVKVSGDGQSGTVNQPLPSPLLVQTNDSLGHPVRSVEVIFSAINGTVSREIIGTDANGQAQTTWTLGSSTGQQIAIASAGALVGSPDTFFATAAAALLPTIMRIVPETLVAGQNRALVTPTSRSFRALRARR